MPESRIPQDVWDKYFRTGTGMLDVEAMYADWQAENARLREAIAWACGYGHPEADFGKEEHPFGPRYWWRSSLVRLAGLTHEALRIASQNAMAARQVTP
jgi:hypothetical protein